ncbi:MAG: TauD/TfdA family dioxygenase [Planctomycetota bacterium]|nr:TauD/TfdA family dioxygenase [Planctomycetota bacterium]
MSLTTESMPSHHDASAESLTVLDGGSAILAEQGGFKRRFPARWLRLMGNDPSSMVFSTSQRAFDSTTIPVETRIRTAEFNAREGCWEVRFEGETDPIEVTFERLMASSSIEQIDGPMQTPFTSADQPTRALDYENLDSPAAVRSLLETLFRRGYARVRGVPTTDSALRDLAHRLGFPGPKNTFPVTSEEVGTSASTQGSSSRGCQPHNDEPYLDPMPRYLLQLCVENSLSGGELQLVDGMNAAETLAMESPIMAAELARWPMLFTCSGPDHDYRGLRTILETGVDGAFGRITFNDRASLDFMCPDDRLSVCTEGYDQLARILQREGLQNRFRVQAGDLVIIDNFRVLHGRSQHAGGERRLLCGSLARSSVFSTWRRARSGNLD